jgi:hypothetical protein
LCFLQAKKKTISLFNGYKKRRRRQGKRGNIDYRLMAAELFSGMEEMAPRE